MDELTYELIKLIKEGSPVVWAVLMRQVLVEVVLQTIWAVVLAIGSVVLVKFGNYSRKRAEEGFASDWEMGVIFSYIGAFSAIMFFFASAAGAIVRLINPEFYAIQFVLQGLGQ